VPSFLVQQIGHCVEEAVTCIYMRVATRQGNQVGCEHLYSLRNQGPHAKQMGSQAPLIFVT